MASADRQKPVHQVRRWAKCWRVFKYIATRERVEIIPDDRPPTQKQTQLIAKLVPIFLTQKSFRYI